MTLPSFWCTFSRAFRLDFLSDEPMDSPLSELSIDTPPFDLVPRMGSASPVLDPQVAVNAARAPGNTPHATCQESLCNEKQGTSIGASLH